MRWLGVATDMIGNSVNFINDIVENIVHILSVVDRHDLRDDASKFRLNIIG